MLEVVCDPLAGEGWLPLEPLGELLHDSGREHVGNHEHVLVPPVVGGDGRGGILVERGDDLFDDHLEMALERDLERLPGPIGIRRGEEHREVVTVLEELPARLVLPVASPALAALTRSAATRMCSRKSAASLFPAASP